MACQNNAAVNAKWCAEDHLHPCKACGVMTPTCYIYCPKPECRAKYDADNEAKAETHRMHQAFHAAEYATKSDQKSEPRRETNEVSSEVPAAAKACRFILDKKTGRKCGKPIDPDAPEHGLCADDITPCKGCGKKQPKYWPNTEECDDCRNKRLEPYTNYARQWARGQIAAQQQLNSEQEHLCVHSGAAGCCDQALIKASSFHIIGGVLMGACGLMAEIMRDLRYREKFSRVE